MEVCDNRVADLKRRVSLALHYESYCSPLVNPFFKDTGSTFPTLFYMTHKWAWQPATGSDVYDMVQLAARNYSHEMDDIFDIDTLAGARNVTQAIVNQMYNPGSEFVQLARDTQTAAVVAYVWVNRGHRHIWSDQEMAVTQMVHVDLQLPVRDRLRLVQEMLLKWEHWAETHSITIICSTTVRRDTAGFLKLHLRHGYDVRGSFAYRRLS